ncbi:xanthine dehydrogenase YagT iron-sulfur-binding subunit [Variovorax beijingensis]|uniref:Xanthine dehydrogenase YagT iron-sulfur-binding subunit n=1 Tax=Variovorax beijingensis TaxID=2496117 RepID=A0A561C1I5_9BURK|nr:MULTISPECIES: (2Fe-2S)-binding protein [Variovorax]MBD9664232.1 (2Fe-2S)-binding protein [Variovorax sp. VRV01]TWD85039.1 xanthine dehydrogenase YagT iron-sulfur-binding subunit [Variovorax beijingensis]
MSQPLLQNAAGALPAVNRRMFMMTTAAGAGAAASAGASAAAEAGSAAPNSGTGSQETRVTINGRLHELKLEPRASLLDVLREQLGLTGAKKGCDHGQCGACTVHVDGRRVASCLTLAVKTDGCAVTTIEGIESPDGTLHPMQQAFLDHDALQCGYCTPGQIMAAIACVREGHATSDAQIREYMSGNICRCGAYTGILEAIREAAPRMRRMEGSRHA